MKRIIILTGSEKRHAFFRFFIGLSKGIEILQTYCEGLEKSLASRLTTQSEITLRSRHVEAREQSEEDFFGLFVQHQTDRSHPEFIPKGEINSDACVKRIVSLDPDIIVTYGSSLIREPLINAFAGRFINVHLGLSPYYRGSGTNYWPLVHGKPEYVGATFMHIDTGIDTGSIIHQIRARLCWGDSPSSIGNRLIVDMARTYRQIIEQFDNLQDMPSLPTPEQVYECKRKEFSEESVATLYENFQNGLVERYLQERQVRCSAVPILENPALKSLRFD